MPAPTWLQRLRSLPFFHRRLPNRLTESRKSRVVGQAFEPLEDRVVPATTVYVDDNWSGLGNGAQIHDADLSTPGSQFAVIGGNAFSTITAAVSAVESNGTVIVANGTYNENVNIFKSLNELRGHGATLTSLYNSAAVGLRGSFTSPGGSIHFDGPVTLVGDTTLTASSYVYFHSTVTGAKSLTVTSTANDSSVYFNGGVGNSTPLTSLSATTRYLRANSNITATSGVTATIALSTSYTNSSYIAGTLNPGTNGFTKTGAALLALYGSNNYSGPTIVSGGTLQATNSFAFSPNSDFGVNGTLGLNSLSNTIRSLSGSGVVSLGSGTLTVSGPASSVFSGTITGTGGLVKSGSGILTLTGTNNYSGQTNITGGRLSVNSTLTGTGPVNVAANATLVGTGSVAGVVTVGANGRLSAGGLGSPGILGTARVGFNPIAIFQVDITGPNAGSGYDQINATGSVNLGGVPLTLSESYVPAVGNIFTIITAPSITGTFDGLPNNSVVDFNGKKLKVTYTSTAVTLTTLSVPTNITLSGDTIAENSSAGTAVGTLSATDLDAGDTATFSLVAGAGDNALFTIVGNQLLANTAFDFETKSSYSIRVKVTDSAGLTFEKVFTINVTNVSEVAAFDVQNGMQQRSFVNHLDLDFASIADVLSASRVQLTRYNLNGSGGTNVNLDGVISVDDERMSLDFGAQGIGGNRNTNVGDGYYVLRLDLDGDTNFETEFAFYRLFGDVNGDHVVNQLDVNAITAAYGQTGTGLEADVNGDGIVNPLDRTLALRQLNQSLATQLWDDLDD